MMEGLAAGLGQRWWRSGSLVALLNKAILGRPIQRASDHAHASLLKLTRPFKLGTLLVEVASTNMRADLIQIT